MIVVLFWQWRLRGVGNLTYGVHTIDSVDCGFDSGGVAYVSVNDW